MSNPPVKPTVLPAWTQGNETARAVPTAGQQLTGYGANQRPSAEQHNWLFGVISDYIAYIDYMLVNATFPVSNANHKVAVAQTLQGQLDQLDAVMSSLGIINQFLPGTVDGTNGTFYLSQAPINPASVAAFKDGLKAGPEEYSVQQITGQWAIVWNAGFQPTLGQKPSALYMTGSSGAGVGGGVAAIKNDGNGVGLFEKNNVNVALLKSLVAGTNMTIVDNGNGTITFSALGGGSSGGTDVHGSAASPILIDPAVGIVPTSSTSQLFFVAPITGIPGGAAPITKSPPIAAGTIVGQRLKLKSPPAANYLVIPEGSGIDQNGPCNMGTYGQTIEYTWDGASWSEDSRRV